MTNEDVLEEFRGAGALREGHFVLSSGLHSPVFLQKNLVFAQPARCEICELVEQRTLVARRQAGLDSIEIEEFGQMHLRNFWQTDAAPSRHFLKRIEQVSFRSARPSRCSRPRGDRPC